MFRLAEMATKVEAAHEMMVRAARMKDSGERNDVGAGMATMLAAKLLQRGRPGLLPDPRRVRLLRGVRDRVPPPRGGVHAHRRGTSDIQRMIIGRSLLKGYRDRIVARHQR